VGADQDLLFGRIALNKKYCTQEQLDKCLILQANSRDQVPLGQILRREGYISDDQHSQILTLQRQRLSAIDPVNKVPKESILLGKLAVREKLMSEFDLNTCLRLQAQSGEKRTIGEIIVAEGYLKPDQVKALLARQKKKIMSCPTCKLSFTVLTVSKAKVISCPRCKGPLMEGKPTDSVRTDAEFETSTSNKLRRDAAPPPASDPSKLSASARLVRMNCPMCEKPFVEPVDSKGRLDCPHCGSSFSA
jgi:ribosomal protein L37AE/L43A